MRFTKPVWLTHSGDKKDFEVYSCHVSPDSSRLVTAAGGSSMFHAVTRILIHSCRWPCADLVDRSDIQRGGPQLHQAEAACFDELPFRHNTYRTVLAQWQVLGFRGRRQNRMRLYPRSKSALPFSHIRWVRRAGNSSRWDLTCGCRQQ